MGTGSVESLVFSGLESYVMISAHGARMFVARGSGFRVRVQDLQATFEAEF